MKTHKTANYAIVLALLIAFCQMLTAQKPDCGETDAMAKMARAISPAELTADKLKAGDSYRARVVFAAKQFELIPQVHEAALLLLNIIPENIEQQRLLASLGYSLCGTESYHDMKSLEQITEHFPRSLARAVLLAPDKIPAYVAYSVASVEDPHSDYAVQMQKICRVRHPEFIAAVAKLPLDKKDRFLRYVFDPDGCNALSLPSVE